MQTIIIESLLPRVPCQMTLAAVSSLYKTHCLLGRIMERFAIANPSRASLAGIEMPPRGTLRGGEVVISPNYSVFCNYSLILNHIQ